MADLRDYHQKYALPPWGSLVCLNIYSSNIGCRIASPLYIQKCLQLVFHYWLKNNFASRLQSCRMAQCCHLIKAAFPKINDDIYQVSLNTCTVQAQSQEVQHPNFKENMDSADVYMLSGSMLRVSWKLRGTTLSPQMTSMKPLERWAVWECKKGVWKIEWYISLIWWYVQNMYSEIPAGFARNGGREVGKGNKVDVTWTGRMQMSSTNLQFSFWSFREVCEQILGLLRPDLDSKYSDFLFF